MNNDTIKQLLSDSQLLLNAVGEGIYGFDTNGIAIFVNAAAEKMTGWKASELLGQNIHQYHHHSHADNSPYPASDCQIYATAQDGVSRHVTNEVFWRKDGSAFPVEYTSTPVFHQDEIIGAVAVFRDVTEQKNNEHTLKLALKKVEILSKQLQAENNYLQLELQKTQPKTTLSGQSLAIQKVIAQIDLVAGTQSTVLITGENGTGKELAARQLHQHSKRAKAPLIKINCAAFTPSLLESELFGHEKGAFTGATEMRKGKFELADKATLFLDEVGELSLTAQSKLLRVIQEQEFERVGGSKVIKVDIRIIAATNRNLKEMVNNGSFRMDLFYRLNVFPIELPPLRERLEDIAELSQQMIDKLNSKLSKSVITLSPQSLVHLSQYSWPGNVRELQNIMEREMILSHSNILEISSLFEVAGHSNTLPSSIGICQTLSAVTKHHIVEVLKACQWRIGGKNGAAKKLGLADSTLRSKMLKLRIKRPSS